MSRFTDPVFISSGLGVTLASANCNSTYYGRFEGYWSFNARAPRRRPRRSPTSDESVQGVRGPDATPSTTSGRTRTGCSRSRWPGSGVPSASSTRSSRSSSTPWSRPVPITGRSSACACTTACSPCRWGASSSCAGAGSPSSPCWPSGSTSSISVALTFGQTRYRSTFEVSLVLLASVQLDWFWSRLRAAQPTRGPPRRPRPMPRGPGELTAPDDGAADQDASRRRRRPDAGRVGSGAARMELDPDVLVVLPAFNEAQSVAGGDRGGARRRTEGPRARGRRRFDRRDRGARPATPARTSSPTCSTWGSAAPCGSGSAMPRARGYRALVQVDGDGQHDPQRPAAPPRPARGRPRTIGGHRCPLRRAGRVRRPARPPLGHAHAVGLPLASTHVHLTDVTSGFRAHNRAAMELFARTYPADYLADTVESLVIAAEAGGADHPGPGRHATPPRRRPQPVAAASGGLPRAGDVDVGSEHLSPSFQPEPRTTKEAPS